MLDNFKTHFSISDLENLTGVSHHTIRIWERRYKLLTPGRSGTNIRYYSNEDLKKLLNVSQLVNHGWKISEIATLNNLQLSLKVTEISGRNDSFQPEIRSLKIAMLDFDIALFNSTYKSVAKKVSFDQIFLKVFIPLLHDIGALWQTGTITPAHEHFISNLIRQKLLSNIDIQKTIKIPSKETFVLFLPPKEIHELGLLFIHYMLLKKGRKSVYLGANIETKSLLNIKKSKAEKVTYISYLTVYPNSSDSLFFVNEMNNILQSKDSVLLTGRKAIDLRGVKKFRRVKLYEHMNDLITAALA